MFKPQEASLIVLEGKSSITFDLDEFWNVLEVNDRVVRIVAPRKDGKLRVKNWPGFNPNKQKISNKGRPPVVPLKQKYSNALMTNIMFYVLSLNPDKPDNHTCCIKFSSKGSLNITGISSLSGDKYFEDAFQVFVHFVSEYFNRPLDIVLNKEIFVDINFRNELIDKKLLINRDAIYNYISEYIKSYTAISYKSLKNFVKTYLNGDPNFQILNDPFESNLYIDINYLKSLLTFDLSKFKFFKSFCPQSIYTRLEEEICTSIYASLILKLIKHKANRYSLLKPKDDRGAVGFAITISKTGLKPIVRKVNIYKKGSYITYCKTPKEGLYLNSIIHKLFQKNGSFIYGTKVVFTLVE